MAFDYTGPQLVTVKGWTTRKIAIYVSGTEAGGPLHDYVFFLVFEDGTGRRMYTLPQENDDSGYGIMERALRPNLDGIIHIGPTPVHPRRGALVIKAFAPSSSSLRDFQARTSYGCCASGTMIFKVEPTVVWGKDMVQNTYGEAVASPMDTHTYGGETSNEVAGKLPYIEGKIGDKRSHSHARTTGQDTVTQGTTTMTERPVSYLQGISIKPVYSPPNN